MNRVDRIDIAHGQHLTPVDMVAIPNNALAPQPSGSRMLSINRSKLDG